MSRPARLDAVGRALERVRRDADVDARRAADPVSFVHAVTDPLERELVGLVAACLAFGNVKAMRPKIADALHRLRPALSVTADDAASVRRRLRGFRHRVYDGADVAGLVIGARRVQRADGSLGRAFARALEARGTLRGALGTWAERIRAEGGLRRDRAGARHILPDAERGSAAKRLVLYLRWMIRPADGVDLGLWDLPPSLLVMPVDTHIHRLGRNLGLTTASTLSWRAAEDITAALRRYDPVDPVKYDFALCHLGMVQGCRSRRDAEVCHGCGIKPVCVHWG